VFLRNPSVPKKSDREKRMLLALKDHP